MQHRLDYVWQAPDHRDFHFSVPYHLLQAQPPAFKLETPPVDDQGQEGSCGPNSIDGLIKYDQKIQGMTVDATSRQFTYYITRVLMGTVNQDSGVDNRTMLKALAQSGFCSETLWPYSKPLTAKPSAACYAAALPNAIKDYAAVEQNLTTMKATLLAGRPFLYGFNCYQQLESNQAAQDGKIAMPSGRSIGGHDVCIFGYDDTIQCPNAPVGAFLFLNSWGTGWGNNGIGYMPYAYATNPNEAGDFWVINSIPGGVNPPPPMPTAKLFSLPITRAIAKNSKVVFYAPTQIPVGTYDWVAETNATAGAVGVAVPWGAILAVVQVLVSQYGPLAKPYIEKYVNSLNLPPLVKMLLNALINSLLSGTTVIANE
jgi:hypothetical protein